MATEEEILERANARVGTTLKDKWHLDRVLGIGGMAAVYVATHRNHKRAALKMLHPELSGDLEIRTRFLREGYAANSVEHPGVVRIDDDDVAEDGAAFLVMELLDGETAEGRLVRKGGKLPLAEVLAIGAQLLEVLVAAHAKGIVHRDLKPENIFLCRDGVLKVLDFGIARVRELGAGTQATRMGAVFGTPAYMAPEQARGLTDEVDARTDLWSVGATMFKLLTGRLVHEAATVNEILARSILQHAPSIGAVMPSLDPAVVRLVDRALAFERQDRFVDAREMLAAVREVQAAGAEPAMPTGTPVHAAVAVLSAPPPARTTARPVTTSAATLASTPARLAALGAVFLVVGLLGALVLARSRHAPVHAAPIAESAAASGVEAPVPPSSPPGLDAAGQGADAALSTSDLPVVPDVPRMAPPVRSAPAARTSTLPSTAQPPATQVAPPPATAQEQDPFSRRR